MEFDKPDRNGRIYPKGVYEKALKKFQLELLKTERLLKLQKINEKYNKRL